MSNGIPARTLTEKELGIETPVLVLEFCSNIAILIFVLYLLKCRIFL